VFRRLYTIAGRGLQIESPEAWCAHLFAQVFEGWYLVDSGEGGRAMPTVTVRVEPCAPPLHILTPPEEAPAIGGWRFRTDKFSFVQEDGNSAILSYSAHVPRVDVWLGSGGEGVLTPQKSARLVFDATNAAMRRLGFLTLHSGCVVEPRTGSGVLFIGPSGSGKSTLTAQLAARGWPYLSDDSHLLSVEAGAVKARALRKTFALLDETVAAISAAAAKDFLSTRALFDPVKHRFQPSSIFRGTFAERCVPKVLIFTSVTRASESWFERMAASDAMWQILRDSPGATHDKPVGRALVGLVARLVRQSVSYRLGAGDDLLGNLDRTSGLISSLVPPS
jgi:hypothetical protein